MESENGLTVCDTIDSGHHVTSENPETSSHRKPRNNAATGASAAGIRALSAQLVAFYFRAPIKAFFRTRVEYDTVTFFFSYYFPMSNEVD
jgi:hypothetical protein